MQGTELPFALQYPAQSHPVSPNPVDLTDPRFALAYVPWSASYKTDNATAGFLRLPSWIPGVWILFDDVLVLGPTGLQFVLPCDGRPLQTEVHSITPPRFDHNSLHLATQRLLNMARLTVT